MHYASSATIPKPPWRPGPSGRRRADARLAAVEHKLAAEGKLGPNVR